MAHEGLKTAGKLAMGLAVTSPLLTACGPDATPIPTATPRIMSVPTGGLGAPALGGLENGTPTPLATVTAQPPVDAAPTLLSTPAPAAPDVSPSAVETTTPEPSAAASESPVAEKHEIVVGDVTVEILTPPGYQTIEDASVALGIPVQYLSYDVYKDKDGTYKADAIKFEGRDLRDPSKNVNGVNLDPTTGQIMTNDQPNVDDRAYYKFGEDGNTVHRQSITLPGTGETSINMLGYDGQSNTQVFASGPNITTVALEQALFTFPKPNSESNPPCPTSTEQAAQMQLRTLTYIQNHLENFHNPDGTNRLNLDVYLPLWSRGTDGWMHFKPGTVTQDSPLFALPEVNDAGTIVTHDAAGHEVTLNIDTGYPLNPAQAAAAFGGDTRGWAWDVQFKDGKYTADAWRYEAVDPEHKVDLQVPFQPTGVYITADGKPMIDTDIFQGLHNPGRKQVVLGLKGYGDAYILGYGYGEKSGNPVNDFGYGKDIQTGPVVQALVGQVSKEGCPNDEDGAAKVEGALFGWMYGKIGEVANSTVYVHLPRRMPQNDWKQYDPGTFTLDALNALRNQN